MNYRDAVDTVTAELDHRAEDQTVGVGVRLALLAWRHLGAADGRWDQFGLELLAVLDLLPELTDVTVVSDLPDAGDEGTVGGVRALMLAAAGRLDRMALDPSREVAARLSCEAAAIGLRRAVDVLP